MTMNKPKNKKILRIKEARIRRGLTQMELAYLAKVDVAEVSRIETGRMNPYPTHAKRLGKFLGITPEELTQEVEPEEVATKS